MTDKVVALRGDKVNRSAGPQPQPDVIDALETLLVAARAGELQAIAYATAYFNDDILGDWYGNCSIFQMLAAITLLAADYTQCVRTKDEE